MNPKIANLFGHYQSIVTYHEAHHYQRGKSSSIRSFYAVWETLTDAEKNSPLVLELKERVENIRREDIPLLWT